jgi:hypothetical protein
MIAILKKKNLHNTASQPAASLVARPIISPACLLASLSPSLPGCCCSAVLLLWLQLHDHHHHL